MSSYQAARRQVEKLAAKYKALDNRQRQGYSEAHTRQDFIEPLFQALGWDVHDSREVSEEEQVSRGRVDYAFRLRGVPCFFLEAKAIPVDLDETRWAVQAITYAYNKGVPWAVLTNFEGLKVFNAEWDEPEVIHCRFLDLTYRDYLEDFDKLRWLSKESFGENRLAKEAAKVGAARKRVPVGERLYSQFREWRELLFKYLFKYNRDRSLRDIDEAIQRILDRLIFIRTCEDRGIEGPVLLPLLRQWKGRATRRDLWDELKGTFKHFDMAYNSRLFQPHLCDALECEATPFETILQELYSRGGEVVRYDFSAIGVDVLGRVYEQYLGHVAGVAQVVAEEETRRRSLMAHLPGLAPKPELTIELAAKKIKRKEHGIYYTPQFVVDYIVEHTLGAFLKDCSQDQAKRVRVLDLACGSGSFLITAYERLMDYFAELQQLAELPQEERLSILTRSIYGVDLDAQAVEIAQLNLLLKALEEPALLPDLSDNIRRGNSLIAGGEDELRGYFGDGWEEKRPFNWQREFPEIMAEGGFDVIIGNPPYVRIQTLDKAEVRYFSDTYQAAMGNYDIYALFVERGWQLLRPGGLFGMILPNKFMQAAYGQGLRQLLSAQNAVSRIVDFGDAQVFEDSTTYTCLLFLHKAPNPSLVYIPAADYLDRRAETLLLIESELPEVEASSAQLGVAQWVIKAEQASELMNKLAACGVRLDDIADGIYQGIRTSANEIYVLDEIASEISGHCKLGSRSLNKQVVLETEFLKPFLRGEEIKAYYAVRPTRYVLVPYRDGELVSAEELRARYPKTWEYLTANETVLRKREKGRMDHEHWHGYIYPKNLDKFSKPKLMTPDIAPRAAFALDENGEFYFVSGYGISLHDEQSYNLKYVLGLLNSQVLDFYLKAVSTRLQGGFYRYFTQYVRQLPIRRIGFDNPEDVAMHDQMVRLVERMLELHRRKAALRDTPTEELREIGREIERTDGEIDTLVYRLYGLTEEEIAVVEGRNR